MTKKKQYEQKQGESIRLPLLINVYTDLPKDPKIKAKFQYAVKSVDSVLNIQKWRMTKVPVEVTDNRNSVGGIIVNKRTGIPSKIEISSLSPVPELTSIHEIGHQIDLEVIGTRGKYSSKNGELTGWEKAVKQSILYSKIMQYKSGEIKNIIEDGKPIKVNVDYVIVYGRTVELFARSFAQYIAIKSNDIILLDQIKQTKTFGYGDILQWSDEDFKPIYSELEKIFEDYRLLRK